MSEEQPIYHKSNRRKLKDDPEEIEAFTKFLAQQLLDETLRN